MQNAQVAVVNAILWTLVGTLCATFLITHSPSLTYTPLNIFVAGALVIASCVVLGTIYSRAGQE